MKARLSSISISVIKQYIKSNYSMYIHCNEQHYQLCSQSYVSVVFHCDSTLKHQATFRICATSGATVHDACSFRSWTWTVFSPILYLNQLGKWISSASTMNRHESSIHETSWNIKPWYADDKSLYKTKRRVARFRQALFVSANRLRRHLLWITLKSLSNHASKHIQYDQYPVWSLLGPSFGLPSVNPLGLLTYSHLHDSLSR